MTRGQKRGESLAPEMPLLLALDDGRGVVSRFLQEIVASVVPLLRSVLVCLHS